MNKVSIKMNKALSLPLVLIIISLCVVCGNNVTVQAQDETPVIFPDPNLEAAIRQRINKSEGPIYTNDLEGLLILVALGRDISDLTGLEYCVNLKQLYLQIDPICDLSPLASLPNLTNLGFD